MLGHDCSLSQTNTFGWVPLCQCGWIGGVVQPSLYGKAKTPRSKRIAELTKSIAIAHHAQHLEDVRADLAARSDEVLAGVGRAIVAANKSLQRRGRWGQS